jgi:hypothetical protein
MLGPIGSNLMTILRVLTPNEIHRYSEEEIGEAGIEIQAMAAGAEDFSTSQHESGSRSTKSPNKQTLNDVEEDEELKAKIIPINEKVKKELSLEVERIEKLQAEKAYSGKSSGLESIGVLSSSQMNEIEAKRKRLEDDQKESTTVFILNQRAKLKSSQGKLAEQAAILQYRKNASQEIIRHDKSQDELDDDSEPRSMDSCGILVNKKHY